MPGKRVLIVDDDPDQVETLAELLRISGHRVECATNPLFAISLAKEFHPQFIFLDIGLPYMNGYEALTKLQTIMEHVPLVLMTGFGYDPGHSIVKCRQAGLPTGAVLYKPFRLDQLLDTVELVVRDSGPIGQSS